MCGIFSAFKYNIYFVFIESYTLIITNSYGFLWEMSMSFQFISCVILGFKDLNLYGFPALICLCCVSTLFGGKLEIFGEEMSGSLAERPLSSTYDLYLGGRRGYFDAIS